MTRAISKLRLAAALPALACALSLCLPAAWADSYHVSPQGDDANPGSEAKPFRTLAGACRAVPRGRHTIRIAPGRYAETEPSRVPPGVAVVGAGAARTVLTWTATVDLERNVGIVAPDRFLIQVYDSEGASLSGFTVDGKLASADPLRDRAHAGILAHRVKDFHIHDVTARSFNYGAIFLSEAVRSSVHHCRVEDSGHPHRAGCTGGICVGDLTDSAIHDNVIREHRGAYGIKSQRMVWGHPTFNIQVARSREARVPLVRAKFYNNDIRVRQQGGWGQGQPNMAIELWNCVPEDCEIYGNRLNECVSLTGGHDGPRTYRVHHNEFVLEPGYSYALEVATQNVEVDHNYFANGYYPIAHFGARCDGLNVHHNVFDGIEKIDVVHFRTLKDFRFTNNTVYVREAFPLLSLSEGESENLTIARNLFYREGAQRHEAPLVALGHPKDRPGALATIRPDTLIVADNAFYNWKPAGERAVTADPLLRRIGRRETGEFFALMPGSPLLAAGIGATAPERAGAVAAAGTHRRIGRIGAEGRGATP